MSTKRQKWTSETVAPTGAGVDHWRMADSNNHDALNEDTVRDMKSVRARFLAGQAKVLGVRRKKVGPSTRKTKSSS